MAEVMGSFDVFRFVQMAIPSIAAELSVTVTDDAVATLVEAMAPHAEQVAEDLATGTMTDGGLREILFEVIQEAASLSPDRPIDAVTIITAMARRCRYLGWC